jgi:hypothetical protein
VSRGSGGIDPVLSSEPHPGHRDRIACRIVCALVSLLLLMLMCASMPPAVRATPHEGALCTGAIRNAERAYRLPPGLLMALALTETGRNMDGVLTPWPWSINAAGDGVWFESRQAALDHTRTLRASGVRSIDVGRMQVNLMWHENAFASLDVAFDPAANVDYAARHIQSLRARSRDWLEAAGRYHSWDEERSQAYLERLSMNWRAVRTSAQPALVVLPSAPGRVDLSFAFTFPPVGRDPSRRLIEGGSGPLLDVSRGPLVELEPMRDVAGGEP